MSNMTPPAVDLRGRSDEVLRVLYEVIDERPDYVYDNRDDDGMNVCKYELGGAPSCLVGHVMHRLGVPVETLRHWDGTAGGFVGLTFDGVVDSGWVEIDDDAKRVLMRAQGRQDGGEPWGECVDR